MDAKSKQGTPPIITQKPKERKGKRKWKVEECSGNETKQIGSTICRSYIRTRLSWRHQHHALGEGEPLSVDWVDRLERSPGRSSPERRCVKLRRILSPQAELSSEFITSCTLMALFCREWSAPEAESRRSPESNDARSPYIWRGVRDGLILAQSVGVLAPDDRPAIVVSSRGRSCRWAVGLDSARRCKVEEGESIGAKAPSRSG